MHDMPQNIRVAFAGLGAVNRNLLALLAKKQTRIQQQYGLTIQVTAIADSSGFAHNSAGFDPHQLYLLKAAGGHVSDLSRKTQHTTFLDLLHPTHCDLLFEGTPVNLENGEPGLTYTRHGLQQGISVVLANKGPLVHHFHELTTLAKTQSVGLAYSATVCGALPIINIGQRDLVAAEIRSVQGIFNSTTNYILAEMSKGHSFSAALAEAQQRGIAEADPSLDIDGWDTANKLVILANSLLGCDVQLAEIHVTGIGEITTEQLQWELKRGQTIKLLATAQQAASGYQFSVAPTTVALSDFLGGCNGWEMGIAIDTDIYGKLYHKSWEDSPIPTAAAMLRDAINLVLR